MYLFSQQDAYRHWLENQLRAYKRDERLLLWSSVEKDIFQGFGQVALLAPCPGARPPRRFCEEVPRRPD